MSGLFKNFDRLISASTFANNQHKYLVKFCLSRFCPASFYFDPNVLVNGLPKDHNLDVFALGLNSASLTRLNANYKGILQDIASKDANDANIQLVRDEVQESVRLNNKAIQLYLKELVLQLRTGAFVFPVQSCADVITTLAQLENNKNSNEIISQFIAPALLQKLQYASTNNLIDIVVGLTKLNYFEDKQLWTKIFDTLKSKTLAWEYNECQYHGWSLSNYERSDSQTSSSCCGQSELEAFWSDVQGGNYQLALLKRQIRYYWNFAYNRIISPFFFRENRVQYNFPTRNLYADKDAFITALKQVKDKFPEVESVFESLKSRAQN